MANDIGSMVVFDIETYARPAEEQDGAILQGLTRFCTTEEERQAILDKLGLYSVTAEVACVGLLDPIRERAAVFSRKDLGEVAALDPATWEEHALEVNCPQYEDEKELLEAVWSALEHYPTVITFNGRGFDGPFLMHRSLILGVSAKKNLFTHRYHPRTHLDLCDYLTGFGVTRKYSLDLWCRALGITSPKDKGIDGSKVSEEIHKGNLKEIANYCMRDVIATAKLAKKVATHFNVEGFEALQT